MSPDGTRREAPVAHDTLPAMPAMPGAFALGEALAPEDPEDHEDPEAHEAHEAPEAHASARANQGARRGPVSLYRIFRRGEDGEAASVRSVVCALVLVAVLLAAIGVIRVGRRHEVLRLGYQLSKKSEQVHQLREARRQLELEHAHLSAPDRIRRLAAQLGMTPVAPDKIRVVGRREVAAR